MTMKPWTALAALLVWGPPRAMGLEILFSTDGVRRVETPAPAPAPTQPLGDYVVVAPVADLRRDPRSVEEGAYRQRPYAIDALQETQLLYGETVRAYEERGGWVRVESPEQPEFTHSDRWQGYPGWVARESLEPLPKNYDPNGVVMTRYAAIHSRKSRWSSRQLLPMGARLYIAYREKGWSRVAGLQGESGWMRTRDVRSTADTPQRPTAVRPMLLAAARQFLGEPYYWGGRAGHLSSQKSPTGVDCSGLVNISYRVAGLEIPRDAHEQFMASRPLSRVDDLAPGDLVFLAKAEKPDRIVHVMMFEKDNTLLEAVHEFNVVRRVTFQEKFGAPKSRLSPGQKAGGYILSVGRLVPE